MKHRIPPTRGSIQLDRIGGLPTNDLPRRENGQFAKRGVLRSVVRAPQSWSDQLREMNIPVPNRLQKLEGDRG